MGQQQTLLAQAPGLADAKNAAHKVLAQNAPSLLARLSPGQSVDAPTGFQPGSDHELIIPPPKKPSSDRRAPAPKMPGADRRDPFVDDPYGNENACDNPYGYAAQNCCSENAHDYAAQLGSPEKNICGYAPQQSNSPEKIIAKPFADECGGFLKRKAQETAHNSFNERAQSFATDYNGGYTGDENPSFQVRAGLPAADMLSYSREEASNDRRDLPAGLTTDPNGIAMYPDEYHAEIHTEYTPHGDSRGDNPYHNYYANANVDGPYDDIPPTNLGLQQQYHSPHQAPPFAYAEVGNAAACRVPGSIPPSPESHQPPTSPQGGDSTDRAAWKMGSILEVYSDSAGSWYVSRVIGVNGEGGPDDVLTVQFIGEDGSKQKSIYRRDNKIVALGARNGGPCELPPGFQRKASQSRPGQSVYFDATTGIKYSSADLAWVVHFERLAKQSSSRPEITVANLRDAHVSAPGSAPMAPLGTALMSESPSQQLYHQSSHSLEGPASFFRSDERGYYQPSHSLEGPPSSFRSDGRGPPSSCRSDGRPDGPISLAQLMNMKTSEPFARATDPDPRSIYGSSHHFAPSMSHHSEMEDDRPFSTQSSFQHEYGVALNNSLGPLPTFNNSFAMPGQKNATSSLGMPPPTAPRDSGGKISLPSFDGNPRGSNQAAYLRHEASYLQSLGEESLDYSREAEMYKGNLGQPPLQPSVPRREPAPAPVPVHPANQKLQSWNEDPFSQWRR